MFMLKKKIAVTLMTLTGLAVMPIVSLASAYGYQYWGGFSANVANQTIRIPSGQLYHAINGSGYHINWQGANFGSVANICEPSVKFTYGYGSYYLNGNVHSGCSKVGQWKYNLNWNAPGGDACAELWAKQWRVLITRQCHYIHG
jgi:hypothetical protein